MHLGGRLETMHRVMIAYLAIDTLLMLIDSIVDLGVQSVVLDCAYYCWLLLVSLLAFATARAERDNDKSKTANDLNDARSNRTSGAHAHIVRTELALRTIVIAACAIRFESILVLLRSGCLVLRLLGSHTAGAGKKKNSPCKGK